MANSVIAIVGARLSSSRLPAKHLLPILEKPVIEHVFKRLSFSRYIDKSVLATTTEESDKPLIEWAKNQDFSFEAYPGPVNRLVDRVQAVVKDYDPDVVVYLCGDCPLVDPDVIDAMIQQLNDSQAMLATLIPEQKEIEGSGQQSINEGMQVFSREGWDLLVESSVDADHQEHVGSVLKKQTLQEKIPVAKTKIDSIYFQLQHRISLDTHADYCFLKRVYQCWYKDNDDATIVSLPWVIRLILNNEDIKKINRHVVQRVVGKVPSVLVLTQASEEKGLGHLIRSIRACFAFQEYWGAGTKLFVLGNRLSHPLLSFVNHEFFPNSNHLEDRIEECINSHQLDCVALDFHSSFAFVSEKVLSCINSKKVPCRVTIDRQVPGVNADLHWVPCFLDLGFTENDSQHYSGWDSYFLPNSGEVNRDLKSTDNIVIISGGSDAFGLGETLPSLLDTHLKKPMEFTWVQGPLATRPFIPQDTCHQWTIKKNPRELQEILLRAKCIIGVYGVSAIEAMAQGKAVILLDPNNRFEREIKTLVEMGIALFAENQEQVSILLYRLVHDHNLIQALEYASRRAFHDGAESFVSSVKNILDKKRGNHAQR